MDVLVLVGVGLWSVLCWVLGWWRGYDQGRAHGIADAHRTGDAAW